MTRIGIVDALTAFVLGLGVLGVANAISQGLVVDPIELRAHDLPQSWQLLSIHVGGRTFVFLGIVESFVVLALLAAAAVVLRPRLARGQTRT